VTRNGDTSGLRRVLELAVTAFGGYFPPAIGFDQLDGLTTFGTAPIL
jgi:hypothetical protein